MVRMNGFIVIDRNIEDWRWWGNIYAMGIWTFLLVRANWKDGYWHGIEVKRGSLITSKAKMAEILHLNRRTIDHWLKVFADEGQITYHCTSNYTAITIVNYDKYQCLDADSTQPNAQPDAQQTAQPDAHNRTKKPSNQETIDIYTAQAKLIIDYFNRKTGKALRYTEGNMKHIRARLREGFKASDFEKVIDAKYREWHGSPKMAKYLRPETLFGTKFDSYLNESGEGSAAIRIDTPEWYKRVKEEGYQEQKASAELIEQFETMKRSMKQ